MMKFVLKGKKKGKHRIKVFEWNVHLWALEKK